MHVAVVFKRVQQKKDELGINVLVVLRRRNSVCVWGGGIKMNLSQGKETSQRWE